MLRREFIQENRMEKFEEVYGRWKAGENRTTDSGGHAEDERADVSALQAALGERRG